VHLEAGELAGPGVLEVERIGSDEVQGLVVALEPDGRVKSAEGHGPAVGVLRRPAHEQVVDVGDRRTAVQRRGHLCEQVGAADRLEQAQPDLAGRERIGAGHATVVGAPYREAGDRDGRRLLERDHPLLRCCADRYAANQNAAQCTAHDAPPEVVG